MMTCEGVGWMNVLVDVVGIGRQSKTMWGAEEAGEDEEMRAGEVLKSSAGGRVVMTGLGLESRLAKPGLVLLFATRENESWAASMTKGLRGKVSFLELGIQGDVFLFLELLISPDRRDQATERRTPAL